MTSAEPSGENLEQLVDLLLREVAPDDPTQVRQGLRAVYAAYQKQQRMMDRLIRVSDRYQTIERNHGISSQSHYKRKMHQLEKLVRISDSYQGMMQDLNARLHQLSISDELTGLPNRRYGVDQLEKAASFACRSGGSLTLGIVDIDLFKRVNDTYGHLVGDMVIREIAKVLHSNLRTSDTCARWGGEEFLILLPATPHQAAEPLFDRLRKAVQSLPLGIHQQGLSASVSIGFTDYRSEEPIHLALHRADEALYEAKALGRNCVHYGA